MAGLGGIGIKPGLDGVGKGRGVAVFNAVVWLGEGLDLAQCLGQGGWQFVCAFQYIGERIEIGIVVGARVGEEMLVGQQVIETFEQFRQERPADVAENAGIGKEFEFGVFHK